MVWQIFRHYLFSRRSTSVIRTIAWLCVFGVGVGILAMVVVLSVMNGFDGSIRKRLLAVEPHLVAKSTGPMSTEQEEKVGRFLSGRPGTWFYPYESQDVLIRSSEGVYGGAVAKGIEIPALKQLVANTKDLNTNPAGSDQVEEKPLDIEELQSDEAILGIDLAHGLGIFEGDELVVVAPASLLLPAGEIPPFEKIKVKKVLRTNVPDVDSQLLFYKRGLGLKRLKGLAQIEQGFEIFLKNPTDFETVQNELRGLSDLEISSWKDRNAALFYSLKMEKMTVGVFLALSVLIGSFSILSALVLLVTQKRNDIGILMSLGLSPRRTRWLFARVGLMLSGIGLFGGLILGLLICWVLKTFPVIQLPDIYYDTSLPVVVDPELIGGMLLSSILVAFLASYLPAWFSTRQTPSETLRGPGVS